MYIRDLQGNEYYLQGTIKHDQELNGDERIDMDIHYTDINAEFLQKKEDLNMWIIIFENKEYRIISTKQTGHGDKYTVSVTGILYILDWLNTHRIYRRIDASLTNYEAFKLVFDDTPFSFNIVDASYSNQFEGLGEGQTRLEMFKTFLDRYDYEMNIVGNVVYLKNKVGNDANFEYRYKVNANNISKDSDAGELWTYAQGYGNYSDDEEGKDVVDKAQLKREYTSPLESVIGERREAPPIRDGRITQQNTMDNALKKLVDESIQISFSADIQDMREQGYNYQVATIGDRVFLVDERIGLDTEIRVVKISRTVTDMGQLLDIQITFGTSSNADNYSSNLTTAVKDITDIMKGRKSIPFTALDTVSKSMVSKIQNTSSELLFDDTGIHAIDKKNANNIVTMNSSGWMLSTDGGRTAKTALTAEGIVADTITTGHLNTQLVSVVGKEGYFFIDGDMLMAKDPDSLSQTVLNPKGLQITRPDGGVYMVNGIPNVSMEVQKNPLYYPSVEFDGINYRTKETEFQTFEYFYASHDGRYLVVSFAAGLAWDSQDASSTVSILLEEFGEESKGIKAVKTFDFKKGDPDIFSTITIDLGVPTYRNMRFYLKFKKGTGGSNNIATIRTTRICMKG
ncbi:phage tail protein [Staphylococcus simulans]|uniref:phage tail protein n=1 Tax=Staphylococcus simulans TaxID=1286 RepID=UPI000D1F87D7|nr:phage tail protein [Staphylococcus simulans]PTI88162.1 hypothetical protein BU053_02530 [Staphylococcus simulans]